MAFMETGLSVTHELRFEVLAGADVSPIDIDERADGGVAFFSLKGVHWLDDGRIEFGLRDVGLGHWPVVSNRPNNSGKVFDGEVLMYDHDSLPKRNQLEYCPVTPDGILEVLRDNKPCTIAVRYVRQLGGFVVHQEQPEDCTINEELDEAA